MNGLSLHGELHGNISISYWWCYRHAFVFYVGITALFYSYVLQACFRFLRVVFDRFRQIHNISFINKCLFLKWLLAFLSMTYGIFLDSFKYISETYHCQIPFSDTRALLVLSISIYFGPLVLSTIMYLYMMYYVKNMTRSLALRNHQRSNQRDFVVTRSIIISNLIIFAISLPVFILWLSYMISGYLHPLIYHLEWVLFSFWLPSTSFPS